jgi:hypothetical protein
MSRRASQRASDCLIFRRYKKVPVLEISAVWQVFAHERGDSGRAPRRPRDTLCQPAPMSAPWCRVLRAVGCVQWPVPCPVWIGRRSAWQLMSTEPRC